MLNKVTFGYRTALVYLVVSKLATYTDASRFRVERR